jgi:hypothetical protein
LGGGAWPFLVGGVICLVNSVNERDLNLLTSRLVNNGMYFVTMTGAESISCPGKVRVILLIPVVLGIVLWNFGS